MIASLKNALRRAWIATPRRGAEILGPGVLLLGLAVGGRLLSRPEAQGQEAKDREPASTLPCARWHRGGGDSQPLDLAAVRRSYRDLAAKLDGALARMEVQVPDLLDRPHKTGFPHCARPSVRVERLAGGSVGRLANQHFYFGALGDPARFRLPPAAQADKEAHLLLLECARWRDVGDLSGRLGRPVSLATEAFAKALGVRCAGTRVRVSDEGDEVEIHEGE